MDDHTELTERSVADVLMGLFGNMHRDHAEYAAQELAKRGLLLDPALSRDLAAQNTRIAALSEAVAVIAAAACACGGVAACFTCQIADAALSVSDPGQDKDETP